MIEFSEPEFSVESLVALMRQTSAPQPAAHAPTQTGPLAELSSSSASHISLSSPTEKRRLVLQPGFQPRTDDRYHVNQLLQYHDRSFIQNAYRAILKRGPDATGFEAFIEGLRSGRLNKIDILARLRYSSEGRAKRVRIKGLLIPALVRQSYRVPGLGYLINLLVALARLPKTMRSQQQFEAHVLAQHEQLADFVNHVNEKLFNHAGEAAAAVSQLSAFIQQHEQHGQSLLALVREQQAITGQQQAAQDELGHRLAELGQQLTDWGRHLTELDQRHSELDRRQAEQAQAQTETGQRLEARLVEEAAAWRSRVEELKTLTAQRREQLNALARDFERALAEALEKQQHLRAELTLQGQRVARLLEETPQAASTPLDQKPSEALADEERHTLDALYLALEDSFRGSRSEIKERLKVYLPLFESAGIGSLLMPILDIGSGRGEWLELLREENLSASGVDHNRLLAAECRERGLEVVEDDLMRYLRSLPDQSLGALTGFHIVEHLPVETLVKLIDEAVRLVKPGGALVFETPNPQNVLVGSCNFYFDPTHRNPLPGPVLKFMVEARGFARVEIINLNPSTAERIKDESDLAKRFNEYFYGPMDYAVVGWRV
ncbi:MAG TPA: methyltransferase domain-containing protein [Pyrinomonadaceae bacterium]|jgi:O-antigen chain-terminating methyltransferase